VLVESVTEAFRPGPEGWIDEGMALTLDWDFDVRDVRCSVTWWHGENDANAPIAPVRRLTERMHGVRLDVWTDAGHLEPYRRYEEILGELLSR
jgi:pimeloyl-ACP methyl ester carboxylesterase